jgi:long-chain fatty acid transport protein
MARLARLSVLLAVGLLGLAPTAWAGGLGRPNIFSSLGLGIGGAGYAGVPDPTTIHYNPAGLVLMRRTVGIAGINLVMAPRTYEPLQRDPAVVPPTESNVSAVLPVPSFGLSTRFARRGGSRPMPFAVGLGFYNTYGGSVSFDAEQVQPGIISSRIILLEVVPAVAYQVTSRLAVGAALRFGIGTFDIENNERTGVKKAPARLAGSGIRIGVNLGIWYQPVDWLRIGVSYSSPMPVEMDGEGEVQVANEIWRPDNVKLSVPWPQWAGLGLAFSPSASLDIYAAVRWIDWSEFQNLIIDLSVINDIVEDLDFSDGVSAHLGLSWKLHPRFTLRGGTSFDSNTIADSHVKRNYLDSNKVTLALGGSILVWSSLYLDLAYEASIWLPREIPVVKGTEIDPLTKQPVEIDVNVAPGRYSAMMHSIALGVRYAY